MKWYIIIIAICLFMIPIVNGIEECQRVVEPEDIPCRVITSWVYPNSCQNYSVNIYNQSGIYLTKLNLSDYGLTGLCEFNFTYNEKGTYSYNISSGDNGIIVIEVKNLIMAIIIGIAIICAIMLWFAYMLADEHIFLKVIIVIGCVFLLTLIPSALMSNDVSSILHKTYMRLIYIFSIYIFVYIIYKVLVKLGAIVPGENKNNG